MRAHVFSFGPRKRTSRHRIPTRWMAVIEHWLIFRPQCRPHNLRNAQLVISNARTFAGVGSAPGDQVRSHEAPVISNGAPPWIWAPPAMDLGAPLEFGRPISTRKGKILESRLNRRVSGGQYGAPWETIG